MILFDRLVTGAQTERQGTAVGDEDLSGTAPISSEQAGNAFLLQHSFPADGIVFAYSIFSNALTNFRFQIWRQDMNGSSVNQFQLIAETSERPSVIGQRQDVNKQTFTRVDNDKQHVTFILRPLPFFAVLRPNPQQQQVPGHRCWRLSGSVFGADAVGGRVSLLTRNPNNTTS